MTPDLATARAVLAQAEADLAAQEAEVAALHAKAEGDREEAARAREARDTEDATRLLLGESVREGRDPGAGAERRATIAARAADLREGDRPALLAALAKAREGVTAAAVLAYLAQRDAAQGAALEAVEALALPLARLLAAEQVRATLAPPPWAVPLGVEPASLWSSGFAATALLAAVPDRLRPLGFVERVRAEADRLAAETLNATGGDHG